MSTNNSQVKKGQSTLVITGKCRLSYANIWVPKAMEAGGKEKYSCQLIFPKTDTKTLEKFKAAFKAAVAYGKDKKWGGVIPEGVKFPVKDGDKPNKAGKLNEAAKGCYFIAASADTQPNIIDLDEVKITNQSKVYSGCYVRGSINLFPYNFKNMNIGVGVGLNNLQFLKDGEPLGGRNSAEYDFSLEAYDDEEEESSELDLDDLMG